MHNITNTSIIDELIEGFYHKNYVVIGLYIPVFLLALSANLLIIVVVIKYHYMRSVTNYFLVNLSIADLLVTFVCMPNGAWKAYTRLWHFGKIACKVVAYLQCVAVGASVFTITAMALDRYFAITKPFGISRRFCFNKKTAVIIICLMWFASFAIFSPILFICKVEVDRVLPRIVYCYENWDAIKQYYPRHVFGTVCFVVMFALPGCLMLYAYSMMGRQLCSVQPPFDNDGGVGNQQRYRLVRERKRVAWILLLLAFVFGVCWLPYNIINLFNDTSESNVRPEVHQYMLLLGHANSALNPVIYCIMSRNFRKSVKELIFRARCTADTRRNHHLQLKFPMFTIGLYPHRRNVRCAACGELMKHQASLLQWADSSGSSQRLYLQRACPTPAIHNQLQQTLSRLQSSQKTTKTCAV